MLDHDTEHLQALALVVQALEGDRQSYVAQMNAVERPHAVAAALVQFVVRMVPSEHRHDLADEIRTQIVRYHG